METRASILDWIMWLCIPRISSLFPDAEPDPVAWSKMSHVRVCLSFLWMRNSDNLPRDSERGLLLQTFSNATSAAPCGQFGGKSTHSRVAASLCGSRTSPEDVNIVSCFSFYWCQRSSKESKEHCCITLRQEAPLSEQFKLGPICLFRFWRARFI